GVRWGMKSHSFRKFIDLPSRVADTCELALGSASAPREDLRRHGWNLADPIEVSRDPWTYQAYIQESRAEFSVAKHGYVASRCGWFSERSRSYLASGRPAIVEETGIGEWLPTGRGLWAVADVESAVA